MRQRPLPACRRELSGGSDSLTGTSGAPRRCEPVGHCRRLSQQHDRMCRSRTYGPLMKSPDEALPQNTQQDQSTGKGEDL